LLKNSQGYCGNDENIKNIAYNITQIVGFEVLKTAELKIIMKNV
jgi:hypothetical protein